MTVTSNAMDNPFGEVPVLPVVIPLALVVFLLMLWRLQIRRAFSWPRAAVAAALAMYAAGIVGNTIFPIFLNKPSSGEPWTPALALVPFADYEIADALTNVLVFVPLGILVALVLARPTWPRVVAISAGVSLAVELSQLAAQRFFAGGHVADINDFLSNVTGGALGYGILLLLVRMPRLGRFVDRFRWAPATVHDSGDPRPQREETGRSVRNRPVSPEL